MLMAWNCDSNYDCVYIMFNKITNEYRKIQKKCDYCEVILWLQTTIENHVYVKITWIDVSLT